MYEKNEGMIKFDKTLCLEDMVKGSNTRYELFAVVNHIKLHG